MIVFGGCGEAVVTTGDPANKVDARRDLHGRRQRRSQAQHAATEQRAHELERLALLEPPPESGSEDQHGRQHCERHREIRDANADRPIPPLPSPEAERHWAVITYPTTTPASKQRAITSATRPARMLFRTRIRREGYQTLQTCRTGVPAYEVFLCAATVFFLCSYPGGLLSSPEPGAQAPASGTDWPQWRGPDRSGVSRERGLLNDWPAAGPAPRLAGGQPRRRLRLCRRGWRPRVRAGRHTEQQRRHRASTARTGRSSGRRTSAVRTPTIAAPVRAAHRRSTATGSTCSPRTAIWRASQRRTARSCGSATSSRSSTRATSAGSSASLRSSMATSCT